MEPITLRLPSELLDELDQEATDAGFSSRSEYIRYVLRNRSELAESDTTNAGQATQHSKSVRLAEQVAALQRRVEALESKVANLRGEVFPAIEEWLDAELQSENATAIMLDAARILHLDGPLATSDLRQRLFDRYPDAYSSANGLWTATVERLHHQTPGFEKPGYGQYDFDTQQARTQLYAAETPTEG